MAKMLLFIAFLTAVGISAYLNREAILVWIKVESNRLFLAILSTIIAVAILAGYLLGFISWSIV